MYIWNLRKVGLNEGLSGIFLMAKNVASEVLDGNIYEKCDIWNLKAKLIILLSANPPIEYKITFLYFRLYYEI